MNRGERGRVGETADTSGDAYLHMKAERRLAVPRLTKPNQKKRIIAVGSQESWRVCTVYLPITRVWWNSVRDRVCLVGI